MNQMTTKLIEELINFLKDLGQLYDDIVSRRPYSTMPRSTYYYNVRRFEKAGLIKRKERKKYGGMFVLTDKCRLLIKKRTTQNKRTDGFSTIIIFDIPEEKHKERDIFRRYLKRNGYTQIQKSVLISPLKVSLEIKDLSEELKIKPFITIISGRIENFYLD